MAIRIHSGKSKFLLNSIEQTSEQKTVDIQVCRGKTDKEVISSANENKMKKMTGFSGAVILNI